MARRGPQPEFIFPPSPKVGSIWTRQGVIAWSSVPHGRAIVVCAEFWISGRVFRKFVPLFPDVSRASFAHAIFRIEMSLAIEVGEKLGPSYADKVPFSPFHKMQEAFYGAHKY